MDLVHRFIECVLDSNTCANIIKEMTGGAMGVWDKDAYERWLRAKNKTDEEFGTRTRTLALCAWRM